MSRRASEGTVGFGSDSFLDIIANIVGILIILIVVAGVRVSNAPLQSAEEDFPKLALANPDTQPDALQSPVEDITPLPLMPAPELLAKEKTLKAEIESMEIEQSRHAAQIRKAEARQSELSRAIQQANRQLSEESAHALRHERDLEQLAGSMEKSRVTLINLRQRVHQVKQSKSPVKKIKHKLTPLSKLVDGKEVHFRVADNRVAYVPIDEFIERLRPQIARHKDWLAKYHSHRGQVGPVDGFLMRYIVERQPISVVEEMRGGHYSIRIGVSQWQIDPEPGLVSEDANTALSRRSAFIRKLHTVDPSAVLTFWVYPDSFGTFRELQTFAHEQGFTVAARPLPFGVPIAGSPNGTRSAGQ